MVIFLKGKSPLWNHLINYKKIILHLQQNKETENKVLVNSSNTLNRRQRSSLGIPLSIPSSKNSSPCASPVRNHRTLSSHGKILNDNNVCNSNKANNDLINDLATIDKLTEVKTEIGLARAFVRLSLEKKMLGEHLRQLLNKGDLLRYYYLNMNKN